MREDKIDVKDVQYIDEILHDLHLNVTKINDSRLDQMIEQQSLLGRKPDERKKLLLDIQRHIINNAYRLNLAAAYSASLRWSYVKDYFFMLLREETFPRLWLDK